jgi:hypothetical protein
MKYKKQKVKEQVKKDKHSTRIKMILLTGRN